MLRPSFATEAFRRNPRRLTHATSQRDVDPSGRRLVSEKGWLPGLEGRAAYDLAAWTLFGEAQFHARPIRYEGQSQAGASFGSETDTRLVRLRSGAAYAFHESLSAFGAFEWERWQRNIHGSQSIQGLQERADSARLLLGLENSWPVAGIGGLSARAALVRSGPEKLLIGFSGVLDEARFETRAASGYRIAFALRPDAIPALELAAEIDRMKIGRSEPAPITRNGRFAGYATQPEHSKHSITFRARYHF